MWVSPPIVGRRRYCFAHISFDRAWYTPTLTLAVILNIPRTQIRAVRVNPCFRQSINVCVYPIGFLTRFKFPIKCGKLLKLVASYDSWRFCVIENDLIFFLFSIHVWCMYVHWHTLLIYSIISLRNQKMNTRTSIIKYALTPTNRKRKLYTNKVIQSYQHLLSR